ncbi:MAG: MIP/aquaporin family protein [Flavobacteriaceae bacterium]|nr:MIP/aquaporin family protein [Flavobacteriaceae bacterium]
MIFFKEYVGEFLGTLLLVFFGCGAVAVSVVFGALNLLGVALIFGLGVAMAIFAVRNICPAHLNPAVSVAMVFAKQLRPKKLPFYLIAQFLGALVGGLLLFLIFNTAIANYEEVNGILRGSTYSYRSAMMFGEYFPNPTFAEKFSVSYLQACFLEGLGTFLLVFVIFRVTEKPEQLNNATPLLIGLTVTILICLIAPFTQGGFNPARDFSPRIVAYFAGWKSAAFPAVRFSFLTVYILSPMLGGIIASYLNKAILDQKE